MRHLRAIVALVLLVSLSSAAAADGLLLRLPKDGTFAKYTMDASAGGQDRSGEFEVRSVGEEEVDGVACRWIELSLSGGGQNGVFKLLIPESEFQADGSAWSSAEKIFVDLGNGMPQEVTDKDAPILGPLMALLAAPAEDAKELAAKSITTDAGDFDCQGTKGSYEFGQPPSTFDISFERYSVDSEEAAFGTVEYKLNFSFGQGLEGSAHFTLKEVGDGAKSALDHTNAN